jgi:O-antigen ligase
VGGYAQGARAGWIGIFLNSNDLAYSLVLLAPLALALLSTGRWYVKPLYAATALAYVATILLTFSRGGLLALCVVALLCLLRWGTPSARLLGAAMIATCVIFVTSFWTRSDTQGLVDHATLDLRLLTIKIGAAMLADHPVFGVGIGCSLLGWPLYAPPWYPADGWLGVHNTAVQVFTETGLVGGSVFVAMFATTLVGIHRAARELKRRHLVEGFRLVSAIEISLCGFLVCSMTGGYLLSWFPYLLLGLASAARLLTVSSLAPAGATAPQGTLRPLTRRRGVPRLSAVR